MYELWCRLLLVVRRVSTESDKGPSMDREDDPTSVPPVNQGLADA